MALSAKQLNLHESDDRVLLRYIHMYWPLAVLVTADDQMPREHAELYARWQPTVAIIDPLYPPTYKGDDSWHWEIVHRWCHRMQVQQQGTVYRYNATGARKWVKPRRAHRPPTMEVAAITPIGENLPATLQAIIQGHDAEAGTQPALFEEE